MHGTPFRSYQPGGDKPRPGKEVAGCDAYQVSKGSLVTVSEVRKSESR